MLKARLEKHFALWVLQKMQRRAERLRKRLTNKTAQHINQQLLVTARLQVIEQRINALRNQE